MRSLKPNSMGAFVPTKVQPTFDGHATSYTKPSRALLEIDRLRGGGPPKVLVIRSRGGIGDVIMTTPTVRSIAKKYGCQVDYATDFDYLDGALVKCVQHLPYIGNVFSWTEVEQRREGYNAVVNLTCPCVAHEKPLAPPINRIDLFARHAGVALDSPALDLIVTPEELRWAQSYLQQHCLDRAKLMMVQPSSSNTRRDMPRDKLKFAVQRVLTSDRDTKALIITNHSDSVKMDWNYGDTHVLNNFDCRQLAALMHYCDLVLCPDSAILHIASALHKKCLTIFGPTDPRARVNYHPEAVAIWPGKELKNYPVWYEDPKDGYLCWKRLDAALIGDAALAMLNGKALPQSRDYVAFGNLSVQQDANYELL